MSNNIDVLVVGAGGIAREYLKVLVGMGKSIVVVTRGEHNASELRLLYPDVEVISGGLESFLVAKYCPSFAIIATPIESLLECTKLLIKASCENILAEKPLTFSPEDAQGILEMAKSRGSNVSVAYNRRAYQSILKASELISMDGGVSSFYFDFTEALFRIDPRNYSKDVCRHWGIANSSHVIDTAFYLCGEPQMMECRQYGSQIPWHPSGSIFTGLGKTTENIPFTYHANWDAPGRWNLEIMTPKRKLIFSPMEILKQQRSGSFKIEQVEHDYSLDERYKPGFFKQVQSFLTGKSLFNMNELELSLRTMNRIFSYY
jgi:predicted dehydrogenase